MINPVKVQLLSLLTLGMVCPIAWAGEPNDANVPLRFETSSALVGAIPSALQQRPHVRPYAAGIAAQGSTEFFAWPRGNRLSSFINFVRQDQRLSLPQKEFLEDTEGLLNDTKRSTTFYYPPDDPNHPQALLYAVSLSDAKRMAQLYVQFARRDYGEVLSSIQSSIAQATEKVATARARLPEVEKSLEVAQKSFGEIRSIVPYRTEQEATEAIGELDRMLTTAEIEIAGIRARLQVVQSYQSKGPPTAVASRLELMFIEETVAMQGAAARKQMATELRTRASRFIDLSQSIRTATEEKKQVQERLEVSRGELERSRKVLAQMKEQEPQVRGNKAVLYSLGYESPRPRANPKSTQP